MRKGLGVKKVYEERHFDRNIGSRIKLLTFSLQARRNEAPPGNVSMLSKSVPKQCCR